MKYRFRQETIYDVLEAIGRGDIPSSAVTLRCPALDPATGEPIAALELEISDEYALTPQDELLLQEAMLRYRLKLKEKV